ncbi:cardiolipin synthase [Sulfurovum sp. XTW-4]|uniref:Cardiolipin synthase n=1 Tax=Sulfurovum xiamenensis TaxID=3019066 RepID=A0ABT7QR22_9BACT|nr:cardiolipin synthase [Sulfurovum xiamenensis]MDM5263486.1 cardiolipin synthase [Sulfurovum xiamenensis]
MFVFSALSHILYQKRSPTSMISWMLSIFFLPYIVVPLYFLIGIRKREGKHKKEYVKFDHACEHPLHESDDAHHAFQNLLQKNGMPPATTGNSFELITNNTDAYDRLLKEIGQAKQSIDICTYIFQFDTMTQTVLDALTEKAKEGIKVRLLMDLVGSLGASFNQKGFKALKKAGGEVAFFTPILKRPFQNYINLRNHRKIYLFDQTTLLSGGMNLSNEYMGEADGTKRWEDLLYCLKGPSVYHFYHIFQNDWIYATKEEKNIELKIEESCEGESRVQVVPSGPDIPTDALYEALLNAIYNAKKRIWIVTPYFVPDENMIQALVIAHHKGVDIKLITPKNSDHLLADMGRSAYMRELDEIGADVVLYEGEMLHAKAILFDNVGGMVGSVNFDNRSLFLNYEVVTFVYSPQFIESIESWMNGLINHSSRGMEKPSKLREAFENVMKVFAPLL